MNSVAVEVEVDLPEGVRIRGYERHPGRLHLNLRSQQDFQEIILVPSGGESLVFHA